MSRKKKRKLTEGGEGGGPTPFDKLNELESLPAGEDLPPQPTSRRNRKNTTRGRLDIRRESAHRGGKLVTVVSGFKGIPATEIKDLAKVMKTACGVGGTVKNGQIEIHGDNRDKVKEILEEAGFQPVFAGG